MICRVLFSVLFGFATVSYAEPNGSSIEGSEVVATEQREEEALADSFTESVLNRELTPQEQATVDEIRAKYEKVPMLGHRWYGKTILLRYPIDLIVRASVDHLTRGGLMADGRKTAAYVLVLAAWWKFGDQATLHILFSDHADMRYAARERLRLRLGGFSGLLRGLTGLGAPRVFRDLEPEIKSEVAREILNSTAIFMERTSAGLVESLGTPSEMRAMVQDNPPFLSAGRKAATLVGRDLSTSLLNKCALLLTWAP